MEFIGPHQLLGALGDLPVLGGQQLGGDGGVQNVPQHGGQLGVPGFGLVGHIGHQVAHQGLGDAGVHGVHGHVVPVIGGPAQGQLAQVPGADDHAAGAVGQVHQHLGPLPGLAVFKGDGQVVHGLADVPEVDLHRIADVHGVKGGADALGQNFGIGLGAAGGAEAGHGHGQNVRHGPVQHGHGPGGDEQGQGGVQSAGQPHHRRSGPGVGQALFQPQGGQGQNLLAPGGPVPVVGGDEGVFGHGPGELRLLHVQPEILGEQVGGIRREGGHTLALVAELLQVQLGDGESRLKPALGQDGPVFCDEAVPGVDEVGGRLPPARIGVDIAADQPPGGGGEEGAAIVVLAHRLVAGGGVQDQGRAPLGQTGGGGVCHPQVLADLHAYAQLGQVRTAEDQPGGELHVLLPGEGDTEVAAQQRPAGGEPAPLIELGVVGQVQLGHQAQQLSPAQDGGAVE